MDWAVLTAGGLLVAVVLIGAAALAGAAVARRRVRPSLGPARSGPAIPPTGAPAEPGADLTRRSLDSLRGGVVVLDPDDTPVLVNPAARAMGLLRARTSAGTGASNGGAAGATVGAHSTVRTLAGRVRRAGVRREVELDLPRQHVQGAADPIGVLLRAVALGGGYVAVEATDVTESHRVARVRRDFVANVGHELKTPIGALQLLAEALRDATGPADAAGGEAEGDLAAARRFAGRIHQESARLGRLVSELLELSRVQGAEPLPEPTPVPLDGLVAEVLDRVRTGAAAKDLQITVADGQGLTAYGNESQLVTAVANLVENAVAYSPDAGEVMLSCRDEGEWVAVEVVDRGIGIPAEDLDRVFERFYRSDRARSRATGGTGLGLAIVKHIATNHGGRVDVTSTVGEGSTFTLRLPARPAGNGVPTGGR